MNTATKQPLTVTERALAEKETYCWSFAGGRIEVRTPTTNYRIGYRITDDGCGNMTCTCPQGNKPICKHRSAWMIDWHGRIPAVRSTFTTARREYPAFVCDACRDRVFCAPVKPCATSGLTFCDVVCMERFFEALNAGELERSAR